MPIEQISNRLTVIRLADDPLFTQEIGAARFSSAEAHVILDFSAVRYLTSANLSLLLMLRKDVIGRDRELRLCGITPQVWGLFTITGLNQLFEVTANIDDAIAALK